METNNQEASKSGGAMNQPNSEGPLGEQTRTTAGMEKDEELTEKSLREQREKELEDREKNDESAHTGSLSDGSSSGEEKDITV